MVYEGSALLQMISTQQCFKTTSPIFHHVNSKHYTYGIAIQIRYLYVPYQAGYYYKYVPIWKEVIHLLQ